MYNYNYLSSKPDGDPFESFVRGGGTLFICPDNSPDAQSRETNQLFGATVKVASEKGKLDWVRGNGSINNGLLKDIDFDDFSPAIWEGKSWSFAEFEGVEPLLKANDHTVVGRKRVGRGQVIFIGFNLPYHIAYYKNYEEAKMLSKIFSESLPKSDNLVSATLTKNKTGNIEVKAKTKTHVPTWIMVSESYFPGWQATVNGKRVAIQKGRPPMMLIRVSGATTYNIKLDYLPTGSHYAGLAISGLGIPLIAGLALFPKTRKRFVGFVMKKMSSA